MKYMVKINKHKYGYETEDYIFYNRQEAKDFYNKMFHERFHEDRWFGGTAYDENHMSLWADEHSNEMPNSLLDTVTDDCGSMGR